MKRWMRYFGAGWRMCCLGAAAIAVSAAASGTGMVAANCFSRGFDVLVRVNTPVETGRLEVFLDAGGTIPDDSVVIERQPLFTGSTTGDDYARRCADRLLRAAMSESGNQLFRVSNARPDTPYFVRATLDGEAVPPEGLHEVRTAPAGEFRNSTHQLLLDIDRPGAGWIGVLNLPGAFAPLLAVCGDGVPDDRQLFFNLANLTDADGVALEPVAGTPMMLSLYGKAGTPVAEKTIAYAPPAGDAAVAMLGTEITPLLQLIIASAVETATEPPVGESFLFEGNEITCRVMQTVLSDGGTQRVVYGWSGSGSVPVSGRNAEFTFALTADSTLDWNWRTNYWLEVTAERGTVEPGSGWVRAGAQVDLTVMPDAEWLFREWSGIVTGADPEVTLTLDAPGMLEALFDPVLVPGGGGMPAWWLTQAGLSGADRDPDADPDRDGESNRREWIADTNPNDPDSAFRIVSLSRIEGEVELTWQGGREARQVVEILDGDLSGGEWQAVFTNLPPTEVIAGCAIQMEGGPVRFFRLRAER